MHKITYQLTQLLTFNPIYHKVTLLVQPQLKRKSITPIYPPPGLNLQIPEWTTEYFLLKIGRGCSEYADKFENINQIFDDDRHQLKAKGIPPVVRKYIFMIREELRRGVLTFEYLERRTCLVIPKAKK